VADGTGKRGGTVYVGRTDVNEFVGYVATPDESTV